MRNIFGKTEQINKGLIMYDVIDYHFISFDEKTFAVELECTTFLRLTAS